MRYSIMLTAFFLSVACTNSEVAATEQDPPPNIVVILADDMGYGDIGVYNPDSLVPTPNLDQLAAEGVRYTDAHSPASVCTPTRYSILTGRYAWRSRLKSGVLWGYSPLLIETDLETVPSLLKKQGYHTAGIGKWHLGFGNSEADYYGASAREGKASGDDFGRLNPGPNEIGFDYFFGIPASLDMKPYLYIENGQPYTPLTGKLIEASGQRRYGGDGFWRKGQIADDFVHEEVLPTLTEKAEDYIREREVDDEAPFFLYFALNAPHTPWLPTEKFRGTSGAGHYGDFSVQVDAVVGQIRDVLEETGELDNTLVIFTSDNGAHWLPTDIEEFGHLANGALRGQKADIHEGGHRVPFIAYWASRTPAGNISDHPLTLTDLMATFASITGDELDDDAGVDSFDFLPSLLGNSDEQPARGEMVHHALDGMFAIREGDWKLVEGLGSGGFTPPASEEPADGQPDVQLYNLRLDPAESTNVAANNPEVVERLSKTLNQVRDSGRSR